MLSPLRPPSHNDHPYFRTHTSKLGTCRGKRCNHVKTTTHLCRAFIEVILTSYTFRPLFPTSTGPLLQNRVFCTYALTLKSFSVSRFRNGALHPKMPFSWLPVYTEHTRAYAGLNRVRNMHISFRPQSMARAESRG